MIAPALRLVAAVAAGATLVGRPKSGVLHLYAGPLTPSGGFVPSSGRTVCRAHTRRLSVFKQASPLLDVGARRVCRRCEAAAPAALGRDDRHDLSPARADWVAAYGHLTPPMIRWAARHCRSVSETHQVGMVASMVCGEKPRRPRPQLTPDRLAVRDMHEAIEDARRRLVAAERTQDERDDLARRRALEEHDRERVAAARRDEAARDRVREKAMAGKYIAPWERRLVS